MQVVAASETTIALIALLGGLLGVVIGGGITLGTTWWQTKVAREEHQRSDAAARHRRAAEILGRVRTWLTDIDPERTGINVNQTTTPDDLDALKARLDVLRDELSIFAAADEDDQVATRTVHLEVALFNTHNRVSWHAGDLIHNRNALTSLREAKLEHDRASALIGIVLGLVTRRDTAELERHLRELDEALPRPSEPPEPPDARPDGEGDARRGADRRGSSQSSE